MMTLTFLGTGTSQGIPVIGCDHPVCLSKDPKDKRLRASVFIRTDKLQLVIDCSPDFRMQMLDAKVTQLDALLFTHEHADHTSGLDDIRQFTIKKEPMPVYAHRRVLQNLAQRFTYIFDDTIVYEGKPRVTEYEIKNEPFYIKKEKIIPIDALHGNLQIFGYRIRNIAYLTDVSFISKEEKEKLKDLDILVLDALRIALHPTHFNLEQALDVVAEVKPKKTFFTHISHRLGFHEEIQNKLPKKVFLAYDGLEISM